MNPGQHMQHPLISNEIVTAKTTEEIQEIIAKLNKQLNYAYRLNNQVMINQLLLVLNTYRVEHNKRMEEQWAAESGDAEDKINVE